MLRVVVAISSIILCKCFSLQSLKYTANSLPQKYLHPDKALNARLCTNSGRELISPCLSTISLDTAVIPSSGLSWTPSIRSLMFLVSTCIAFIVSKVSMGSEITLKRDMKKNLWLFTDVLFPGISLVSRIAVAKIGLLIEKSLKKIASLGEPEEREFVGQNDWSICTLSERESLSNKYVKYRFELENPAAYIPLDIGQEVSLILNSTLE